MKRTKIIATLLSVLIVLLFTSFASDAAEEHPFYMELGPVGMFHLGGTDRDFDSGPGAELGVGYNFGKLDVRFRMIFASLDDRGPCWDHDDCDVTMINPNVDLKLHILELANAPDSHFDPYGVIGIGGYFLTDDSNVFHHDGAAGFGGNLGIGLEYKIIEHLAVGIEQNFHFVAFVEDQPPGHADNTFDQYFLSVNGHLTVKF